MRAPTGRCRVHPDAPDAEQEALRAEAGFPWCDTCKAPAVWSEGTGNEHATVVRLGTQLMAVPTADGVDHGHEVTMTEWGAADAW